MGDPVHLQVTLRRHSNKTETRAVEAGISETGPIPGDGQWWCRKSPELSRAKITKWCPKSRALGARSHHQSQWRQSTVGHATRAWGFGAGRANPAE